MSEIIEYGKGCLPEKLDLRDYKLKKNIAMAIAFPDRYECQRGPYLKNQGTIGSCVAHATTEILESHNFNSGKLSTNFLYGIHKKLYGTVGPGMYLRDAAKIVKEYGCPSYELCPGNTEVTKVYSIADKAFERPEVLQDAAKNRIDSFAKLKTINDVKYALVNYGPVLASVNWYNDARVVNGVLTTNKKGNGGGHAIMIYGWNEQGWLIQNSWGRIWGVNGCCIIPYDYQLTGAYSFVPSSSLGTDVKVPSPNKFTDFIFKILNFIINLFKRD